MEYTVRKLSCLAGISPRTIRYYDEIGILKPARINSSGYRIYGSKEVDTLQQILFFRELGVELETIREIINDPDFDKAKALFEHRSKLIEKRAQLDILIENVNKTIELQEGRIVMSDKEKFEGFKQGLVTENEEKYGKEVRARYGDEVVDKSNKKILDITQEEYDQVTKLSEQLMSTLSRAMESGDPGASLAQQAAALHKQWLNFYWDQYSPEAHAGLAEMYVEDERFKAYYDREKAGTAEFLRDAILIYTKNSV